MTIIVQNVLGSTQHVRVNAHTENRACTEALAYAKREYGSQGWRVLRVETCAGVIR